MIITIARQSGCGALHIGKKLSAIYGIPFYTRKGLMQMAKDKGVLEEMDDFFEERPVDELIFAIAQFDEEPEMVNCKAFKILSELIGTQDCIIIGRCGNYIFRERKDLVSVFLKGSLEDRITVMEKEHNVSRAEAEEIVNELDENRVRFHKYYTGKKWGDASDYDLCFDSIRLGTDRSVDFIEQYIREIDLKLPHQNETH